MGLFGIDLERPKINNPDGSFSTERTITIEADGKHFLIPTIVGGKQFDPQDAIKAWRVGLNQEVGIFNSAKEAETAAVERSKQIGQLRGGKSMGLLDRDLEELLARFAPSEQDRKSANSQAAIALGLSLLGTRKGQEWQSLGNAGMNAMGARQQYLSGIGPGKLAALGGAAKAMELTGQLRSQKDLADYQDFLRNQGGATALPTAQPPSGPMPQQFQAPPMPPTVSGVLNRPELPQVSQLSQGMPPPPQQPQAQESTVATVFKQLMARADQADAFARQTGNQAAAAQATKLRDDALKFAEKYSEPKVGMVDGTARNVRYGEHGGRIIEQDVAPTPKFTSVSRGGTTDLINEYGLPTTGASFAHTMDPSQIDASKRGWAQLAQSERHWQADNAAIDPANLKETAKAIANYQQPPLTSWAMAKPQGQALMGEVMKINPTYSAQDYNASQVAMKAFATGKQGQAVNSFNVALAHLDTLQEAGKALKNGDVQLLNKASNYYKQQSGSPAPTNFEGIKQVVAAEVVKAITNSGGGVEDRKAAAETINKAASPAQLDGVIGKYKELMTGQLKGLRQQYEANTKRKDFNAKLSSAAQKLLGEGDAATSDFAAADRILGK